MKLVKRYKKFVIGGLVGLFVLFVAFIILLMTFFRPFFVAYEQLQTINPGQSKMFSKIHDYFTSIAGQTSSEEVYQQIASKTHDRFRYKKDDEGNDEQKERDDYTDSDYQEEQLALDTVTGMYVEVIDRYKDVGMTDSKFALQINSLLDSIIENNKVKVGEKLRSALEQFAKDNYSGYMKAVGEDPENQAYQMASKILDNVDMYYSLFGIERKLEESTNCTWTYYSQYDEKWKNAPFGDGTVGADGCGPTSLAMIVQTFLPDMNTTPDVMAKFMAANGYKAADGIAWGAFGTGLSHYTNGQMSTSQFSKLVFQDGQYYKDSVSESNKLDLNNLPLIVSTSRKRANESGAIKMEGCPVFTNGGHIMVVKGSDGNGNIVLNDPASDKRSNVPYSVDCLNGWAASYWKVESSVQRNCDCSGFREGQEDGSRIYEADEVTDLGPNVITGPPVPDNVLAQTSSPFHDDTQDCTLRDGSDDFGSRPWTGRADPWHYGQDVNNHPVNATLYSIFDDATVSFAGYNGGYGNMVKISKEIDGVTYTAEYGHLDSISVSEGQKVNKDTVIGIEGGSGANGPNTYGIHLHLNFVCEDCGTGYDGRYFNPAGIFKNCAGYERFYDQSSCGSGDLMADPPGEGVERWRSHVQKVLADLGLDQSQDTVNRVLKQIEIESGGNPEAINLWDSNAIAGYPSQGLMQTIPATFLHYTHPDFQDIKYITNGYANIYAGVNYAAHRYGPDLSIFPTTAGY